MNTSKNREWSPVSLPSHFRAIGAVQEYTQAFNEILLLAKKSTEMLVYEGRYRDIWCRIVASREAAVLLMLAILKSQHRCMEEEKGTSPLTLFMYDARQRQERKEKRLALQ